MKPENANAFFEEMHYNEKTHKERCMMVDRQEESLRLQELVPPLLQWYRSHKRKLPWRERGAAYDIWVSEIMLQQTRVEAVKPYYRRFMEELPDIRSLASCPEEKLLKLWEGLGYYNRVRNMQTAAKTVLAEYDGELPASYEKLLSLKGIGSYTAGAIASIAYRIAVPAVDGNVMRVITRITEDASDIKKNAVKTRIEKELAGIMPKDCPGEFNQALMELGATVCVPNGPARCTECPVQRGCLAALHGTTGEYPVKSAPKPRSIEERTVLLIQDGQRTAIRRRPSKGLLAGLYELPNVLGYLDRDQVVEMISGMGLEPLYVEELGPAKHIFSHIEWHMKGYRVRVASLELFIDEKQPGDRPDRVLLFEDRAKTRKHYAIPAAFAAYYKNTDEF